MPSRRWNRGCCVVRWMRNVGSMIEFKQIVGRGTRVYDGKDYFTIVDFYGNDSKFQDPEWDGEPAEVFTTEVDVEDPAPVEEGPSIIDSGESYTEDEAPAYEGSELEDQKERKQKTIVRLADGKSREIKYSVDTQFYMDGKPVGPAEFLEILFGELPEFYTSEEDLRIKWSNPRTRALLLQGLAERGFDTEKLDKLKELIDAEECDVYDVLRYISYAKEAFSRGDRADFIRNYYLMELDKEEREFVLL